MKAFTTADLNKQIGTVTEAAMKEPVFITHHRRPRFVLMTVDEYQQLASREVDPRKAYTLDELPENLRDGLLELAEHFEADDE